LAFAVLRLVGYKVGNWRGGEKGEARDVVSFGPRGLDQGDRLRKGLSGEIGGR